MSEERVKQLEEEIEKLKSTLMAQQEQILELKRSTEEPPYVLRILDYIKVMEITSSGELREKFATLHGANLTRLFDAVERSKGFRAVRAKAKTPSIFAYFGASDKPTTPGTMAVDYFQRIPSGKWTNSMDGLGRRRKAFAGPEGSLEGMMEAYSISREKAYEVWGELIRIFGPRIVVAPAPQYKFRRKY